MAAAQLLAIGNTAAASADIPVTVGAPVTVALKWTVTQAFPAGSVININIKGDAGNYFKVGELNNLTRAVTLTGPGTYQLARPTLTNANSDGLGAFSG